MFYALNEGGSQEQETVLKIDISRNKAYLVINNNNK